jgi:hypothetical protein
MFCAPIYQYNPYVFVCRLDLLVRTPTRLAAIVIVMRSVADSVTILSFGRCVGHALAPVQEGACSVY